MQDIVKINQQDNVAVALRPLTKGETLDVAGEKTELAEDIPQGHKFALRDIKAGEFLTLDDIEYDPRCLTMQMRTEMG